MRRTATKLNVPAHPSQSGGGWRGHASRAALALLLALTPSCGVEEILFEAFRGDTPRERHGESLERAGLGDSHMVRAWRTAGERALAAPVETTPPLLEELWLAPGEPAALGYRIRVERGQQIRVAVHPELGDQDLFVELFRMRGDGSPDEALLIAWTGEGERSLRYDARTSATYVLRLQPELLAGGPVQVELEVGASLAFPVQDRSTGNVGSFFGDVRDGGARDHHGVDIFAPRGTPVLAASDGVAYRVGVNRLGGNVVWVRDPSGDLRQYYAHLDVQLVEEGALVRAGDTLGLVGNTGNAITTPPHLHFGIYMRGAGPVDPMTFLREPTGVPAPLSVPTDAFQETRIVGTEGVTLRSGPSAGTDLSARLDPEVPVLILGGTGSWYRVRTTDGLEGYLPGNSVRVPDTEVEPMTRLALSFPSLTLVTRGPAALEAQE